MHSSFLNSLQQFPQMKEKVLQIFCVGPYIVYRTNTNQEAGEQLVFYELIILLEQLLLLDCTVTELSIPF